MGHHLMFGGSYRSLVFNANDVVNQTPNADVKIPLTKYKITNYIEPIFKSQIHIKCKQCSNYISSVKSNTQCEQCQVPIKSVDSDYFHYIPIKQQIDYMLKANVGDILEYYSNAINKPNQITDIQNAQAFITAQKKTQITLSCH